MDVVFGYPAAGDPKTTSTGKDAVRTYGIAANLTNFPIGTEFHVSGYGVFKVDDRCGKSYTVKYDLLDLRIPSLKYDGTWRDPVPVALNHGVRRNRTVLIRVK